MIDVEQSLVVGFHEQMSRLYPEDKEMTKSITFQVTDACNLACSYCYQINKGKRVMSLETAKKFIDLLLSGDKGFKEYIGDSKSCILEFIGGEPFLQVDLIEEIYDYFIEQTLKFNHPWLNKHKISICSNGTLYFTDKVQKFLKKHEGHLSFNISIDGNKELHDMCRKFPDGSGSYDIASSAVADWVSKGNFMDSKMTIAPANVSYVYEASKAMVEKGYSCIHINCVFEEGWTLDHAKILYQQLKKFADYMLTLDHPEKIYYAFFGNPQKTYCEYLDDDKNWCGGDGAMISLDPDGRIYPCIRYMESSLGTEVEPLCIGDVDSGIGKCASCQKCLKMLDGITRSSQSTKECLECPIASGCGWCSGYNYQRFGTLNKRATFICNMHRAASLANTYYINKLNKKFNDKDRCKVNCQKEFAIPIIGEDEYDMLIELSKEE